MVHEKERRSFLKQVLAGSTVITVAALTTGKAKAGPDTPDRRTGQDEILYRETEAFKKYYQTLR